MADRIKFKDLSPAEKQNHRDRLRHSAAHVLAEAVTKLFPEAQLTIGPPTKMGSTTTLQFQNHSLPTI